MAEQEALEVQGEGVEGEPSASQETAEPAEEPTEEVERAEPRAEAGEDTARQQQELTWYTENYRKLYDTYEKQLRELQEYTTAAMTDEERQQWDLEQRTTALTQREQQLRDVQYAQALYGYYQQFVPAEAIKGESPSEWQQNVLEHMAGEVQRLQQENETLRAGTAPGKNAPKVSSRSQRKPSNKSVWDMTWDERNEFANEAAMGRKGPQDFPTV